MYRLLGMVLLCISGCASTTTDKTSPAIAPAIPAKSELSAESLSHYLAGSIYLNRGDIEAAAEAFRKAAETAPESRTVRMKLISIYLRTGDFEKAIAECESAVKSFPDDQALHIVLGSLYQRAGRYDDAARTFEKVIDLDPGREQGYMALMQVAEEANDLVAIADTCTKLIELRPTEARLHLQLGTVLARMNDLEGSKKALLRSIELDSANPQAHYVLGLVYLDLDDNAGAVSAFERVRELEPDHENLTPRLAAALARTGRDGDAIDRLRQSINAGKGSPGQTLQLMCLLVRAGRSQEALEVATPLEAPVLGALLRACAKQRLGAPVQRVEGEETAVPPIMTEFESLNVSDSDVDEEIRAFLGDLVYLTPGKTGEEFVAKSLSELRSNGVQSKWLDLVYARTLMTREVYPGAEAVLQLVLATYGDDKYAHLALATIYESLDRYSDCERHLKNYLAIDPSNPEVLNFLGYLYADENRNLDEAEQLIKRALEQDPDNGYYLDSLGWVYYRKGNAAEAIRLIRQAIMKMPEDDAELRSHLGDAYLLEGDVQRAVSEWQRALRLDPELEGLAEKIEKHRDTTNLGRET